MVVQLGAIPGGKREKEEEERLRKLFDKRNKAGIGGIEEEPKTPEKPKTPIGSSDVPTATTGGATAPPQVEIIRNADTGKASGIRLPDGREFLGIGEDEIRGLASKFGGDLGAPIIEASEAGRLRTEQEAAEERLGMLEEREKNKEEPITQTPTEETGVQGVDSQGNIIGTVTPITASDLATLATLFTPIGLAKGGTQIAAKQTAKKLLITTPAQKAVAKPAIVKSLSNFLKSRLLQVGAGIFAVNKIIGLPERKLASQDSRLSQIRESITIEVGLAKTGEYFEALDNLDEYSQQIDSIEADIKKWENLTETLSANPEKTSPVKQRIKKLRRAIELADRQIQLAFISGNPEDLDNAILQLNLILENDELA